MAIRKASDSNLTGKKYNDGSAGGSKIADVPSLPTLVSATNVGTSRPYNNAAATISVTRGEKGGIPASYTATSTPGSITATSATSPITVTGLQSGTSYTFVVKATGGSGSTATANTAASSSITATSVPDTPTVGTASKTALNTVSIPFTAPATGGSAITSYLVQSSPSVSLTVTGSSSPLSVTGSFTQNGTYTFTVVAVNALGNSVASGTTNSVTPNPIPLADADSFTRTTTLTLGNTETAGQPWTNLTGVWYANGSQAQSDSGYAVAIIRMNSNNGVTKAGTLTPGTGLVYWATDSSNYMATYNYSTEGTSTNCGGYSSRSCSGNGCNPGSCCTGVSYGCSSSYVQYSPQGSAPRGGGCDYGSIQAQWAFCCNVGNYSTYYSGSCGTNATVTTVNNYLRTIKVEGGSATTIEDYAQANATAISATTARDNVAKTNSMRVTTSSNTATIDTYSDTGYGGTTFTQRVLTPSYSGRSNGFGIIKTSPGTLSQGSVVDDFDTSGF